MLGAIALRFSDAAKARSSVIWVDAADVVYHMPRGATEGLTMPDDDSTDSSGLTPKQAQFCAEYLKDLNATRAAIRAGYSEKTAGPAGGRLLKDVRVAAAIAEAMEARAKRTDIDSYWVLRRLAEEAEADLADLIGENGEIRPVKDWPPIWRMGLVAGIDVLETTEDGVRTGQTVKIKLSDRVKRLELIGKHVDVSAFEERVKHEGSLVIRLEPDSRDL